MARTTDDQGGFFRGFRQSPVGYSVAWLTFAVGAGLALWHGVRSRIEPEWLPWFDMALIGAPLLWAHLQPWARASKQPLDGLQQAKRRRSSARALAGFGVGYATLFGFVALKFWRLAKDKTYSMGLTSVPVELAYVERRAFLIAGGLALACLAMLLLAFSSIRSSRKAARAIRRLEGRCVHCNYDLRGLTEPRCPECGTAFEPGDVSVSESTGESVESE